MQMVKQSVERKIPCLLIESSDGQTPDTGVAAGSVTISYRKEAATSLTAKTATGNWTEVGKGVYLITWSTTDLNTVGRFDFIVEVSGDINYYGSLVVSANLLDDLATDIAALNDLDAAGVLAAVTNDDTKWAGAHVDAAISTRSSHSAADVVALLNDPTVAAIVTGIWTEAQAGYTTPGTFGYFLDLQVSAAGGGAAPTVAQIAEAVHDVKVTFNKTTGGLVITMADDMPLTSVTITDTAGEVTRE